MTKTSNSMRYIGEDTYPAPSACEVGCPVPFLAAFISLLFPPCTHSLLGGWWASIQSGHRIVNRQKGHSALFRGHGFFRACVSMGFIETRPVV